MRKLLLGVFVLAAFAAPTFAADKAAASMSSDGGSEILFGTSFFGNNFGASALNGMNVTTSVNVGYQRAVMPMLQLGIRGNFGIAVAAQAWGAHGWATWNFDEKYNDAWFLGVAVGMVNQQTTGFLDIALTGEFGKRIEVLPNLTYRPTLAAQKLLNGAVTTVALNFFAFSYVW
jgi:hypothetical protein